MKLTVLFIQRKEQYPGQRLPEALAIVDEGTMEENPEWWPKEVQRQLKDVGYNIDGTSDIVGFTEVSFSVSEERIRDLIYRPPHILALNVD